MANICSVFFSFLVVGLAVLVGLYFSQSAPDTLPEKHHTGMLFFAAGVKASYFLDFLISYIGIRKKFETFRRVSDWIAKTLAKEETSLHIQDTKIANVPVRIYRPNEFFNVNNRKLTGVVYFHGGGWIYGSVEMYHPLMQSIAKELDAVVISVDYRMAPEFTFPAQFHDCRAVVETLLATGEQYGINTDRIVVSGDSAGGNLAAAVALKLKNEKKKPAAQILIYPVLQFMDFKLPSFRNHHDNIILSAHDVAFFWSNYITGSSNMASSFLANNHSLHLRHTKYFSFVGLPEEQQERTQKEPSKEIPRVVADALTDFRAAPLMADDLTGLPNTMLITSEYDVIKDDGVLFKARLLDAGVQVSYFNYMTYHAFLVLQSCGLFVSDAWRQAVHDIVGFIKEL